MEFEQPVLDLVRILAFLTILLVLFSAEILCERRPLLVARPRRYSTNIMLMVVSQGVLRLALPFLALGMAVYASEKNWGLLNQLAMEAWLEFVLAIILLDMCIYFQHVAMHKCPFLWAFHKIHHADQDIDVTTGVRFHPGENLLSMLWKLLCVVMIGPYIIAVFVFEILLNAASLFGHANVSLPAKLDKMLRYLMVTPDMHLVHHSAIKRETDSNYGFCLSIWDRFFRTYRVKPQHDAQAMTIGLPKGQPQNSASWAWVLVAPIISMLPEKWRHQFSYRK